MSFGIAVSLTHTEGAALSVVERLNVEGVGHHYLRHLEAFPASTLLPAIAARVGEVRTHAALRSLTLLLDVTEVGAPIVDVFRGAGVWPRAVWVVGDQTENSSDDHIPRSEVVGTLQVLIQTHRLHVAEVLLAARSLTRDLGALRDPRNLSALVRAVALAAWQVERCDRSFESAMSTLAWMAGRNAPKMPLVTSEAAPCPECGSPTCNVPWHRSTTPIPAGFAPEFRDKFSTRRGVDHRGGHSFIGGWSRW